ncbi:hypothetical protein [Nocardia iowensis]|uniref:Uncharacterized protein n=1 Tax=Nocardia iowensis TaxID=204891 RepID=A0ABX8RZL2_NOCIO|nr:hypothetical protein [Nocardia iowensis]QXN94422.1 hypothetical protein KV110_15985 [Nocardia iowensis]
MTAVDEDMVQAAVNDPATGRASVWFNSGDVDGQSANRFVAIDADNKAASGVVPGMVLAAGYCDGRLFAISEDRKAAETGTYGSVLYEISPAGELAVRGRWDYPEDFRPATRSIPCSADGTTLSALYASNEARLSESGEPGLTLVRIDATAGSRTETQLVMHGYSWRISRGSLTRVGEKLFWSTIYGDILSVPIQGDVTVSHAWKLPSNHLATKIDVNATTVAQLDFRDVPSYSTYELTTGKRRSGPISLPWLRPFVDSVTESGESTYTVTDIAAM